jgi:hypothetical protein
MNNKTIKIKKKRKLRSFGAIWMEHAVVSFG